jgi:uncharacterized membrane protein YbhN (UPF0104 family)
VEESEERLDPTSADQAPAEQSLDPREQQKVPSFLHRRRTLLGAVVIISVLVAAGFAVYGERHAFADSLRDMGWGSMLLSFVFALVGVSASGLAWRSVLGGLGVRLPLAVAARLYFVTQLGKYLPGSVWPTMMQMEAGKARNISRRTIIGASMVTVTMSCTIGLLIAALVLPFYDASALAHYWWALLAVPFLLALIHPRTLPAILDRAFRILRRPPVNDQIDGRAELRAAGWFLLVWLGMGAHLWALVAAVGPSGPSALALCLGAMALAIPVGVLFIPAPAGAGIRDLVLLLVLHTILPSGQALGVVVASRALLIGADVALAGVAGAALRRHPVSAPTT